KLRKALDDLSEEGVVQVFYPAIGANWIIGVVGQLQLEVLISPLSAEYKVEAGLEPAPLETARWISGDDAVLDAFANINRASQARERDGNLVFMAKWGWDVNYQKGRNPEIKYSARRER